MKHRIFLLICSLAVAIISQAQTWKTFSDTSILFTAKYPPNWVNKIKEGKRVFFTSPLENEKDSFAENINISVTKNPAYGTEIKVTEIYPAILDNLKPAFKEFTLESQRYFKWNNAETCEIIYTGFNKVDESIKVRITQWFCFYKTRLYTLTYTSEATNNTYTVTAQKIMAGIVFTK
jgi:hypothetical protein